MHPNEHIAKTTDIIARIVAGETRPDAGGNSQGLQEGLRAVVAGPECDLIQVCKQHNILSVHSLHNE